MAQFWRVSFPSLSRCRVRKSKHFFCPFPACRECRNCRNLRLKTKKRGDCGDSKGALMHRCRCCALCRGRLRSKTAMGRYTPQTLVVAKSALFRFRLAAKTAHAPLLLLSPQNLRFCGVPHFLHRTKHPRAAVPFHAARESPAKGGHHLSPFFIAPSKWYSAARANLPLALLHTAAEQSS